MNADVKRGLCIYHKPKQLAFLQMPKNASTIVRLWGKNEDWDEFYSRATLKTTDRLVVVLRDPVDRYISAANMFMRFEGNMFHHKISWANYISEDKHFVPQHCFLTEPEYDKHPTIDYFYYNPNVIQEILDHYGLPNSNEIFNNNNEPVIRDVYEEKIRQYYAKDYELINSVNFINK